MKRARGGWFVLATACLASVSCGDDKGAPESAPAEAGATPVAAGESSNADAGNGTGGRAGSPDEVEAGGAVGASGGAAGVPDAGAPNVGSVCGALDAACCPGFACEAGLACRGGRCSQVVVDDFGAACKVDAQCAGGLCIETAGEGFHCSSTCKQADECLVGWSCDELEAPGLKACQCQPSVETCNGTDDDCDGVVDGAAAAAASCAKLGPAAACTDGKCACAGLLCGDLCVDPKADSANCGACGTSCAIDCGAGACLVATALSVNNGVACALLSDGSLRCWGDRAFAGQRLDPQRPTPLALPDVQQLALSASDACAVLGNGSLACWGGNNQGSLGVGNTGRRDTPTLVPTLSDVVSVARSLAHACAIIKGGKVMCWGLSSLGQTGTSADAGNQQLSPVEVVGLTGEVTQLALGNNYSCALLSDRSVACWGSNSNGQLGDDSKLSSRAAPGPVPGLSDVKQLVAGAHHTCALLSDGKVSCWGANAMGQLGDGTNDPRSVPTPVLNISTAKSLAAGGDATLAILEGDEAVGWGNLPAQNPANKPGPVALMPAAPSLIAGDSSLVCGFSAPAEILCFGEEGSYTLRWR